METTEEMVPLSNQNIGRTIALARSARAILVVGISWYEAWAYARWLNQLLEQVRSGHQVDNVQQKLVADLMANLPSVPPEKQLAVRLPTEQEWERMAGGTAQDRFAWDPITGPLYKSIKFSQIVIRYQIDLLNDQLPLFS